MNNIQNLALQASAGTGKTFNLSLRFIALVLSKEKNESISNILAITFTKKAANEMKERIISTFLSLDDNSDESKEKLAFLCDILGLSKDEILKRQREKKPQFLRTELKIYTFDAFFGQILRQFCLNVGLMPDFEIDQNLDALINENYIKSLSDNEIEELASYIKEARFTNVSNYLEAIKKMSLYDISFNAAKKPDESAVLAAFNELKIAAMPKTNVKYQHKFEGLQNAIKIADFVFNGIKSTTAAINECESQKEKLITELKKYYEDFKKFKISNFFEHIEKYKISRAKSIKKLGKLDFSDVSVFVAKLLKNGEKHFDINELYFRLDSRICDILIDEFQDTNALQYEIMLPLINEALAGKGQNDQIGSLFYVGDVKQSIYAFRDAQKDIFKYLYEKEKLPQKIHTKSLKTNFRSDKNIVKFIDDTFKDIMSDYEDQSAASKDDGFVDISSFAGMNYKGDEFLGFEEVLIEKIKLLKNKNINDSDITILCWENKDIIYIKEILLNHGFKVASKAKKLTEVKSVKLILAYLQCCLFKSEFYKTYLEQFGKKVEPLNIAINEPEKTLKQIASKLEIMDANVFLLYEIALNCKNIYEFLSKIKQDATKAHQASDDGINIMTVHSSKGLGFEHCIVCDNLNYNGLFKEVFLSYFDLDKKEWQITLDDKNLDFLEDEEHRKIKAKVEQIQKDEELNKLYVAFTRAKHSLIVLCAVSAHASYPSYFKFFGGKEDKKPVLALSDTCFGEIKNHTKNKRENKSKSIEIQPFEKIERQKILDENTEISAIKPSVLKNIYFGEALHYAFEMSGDFSTDFVDLGVQASFNKYGALLSASAFDDIKARILSFAKLKEREFSGFKMYKEQEILYNSRLLRLDLLLVNDEKIVIIDYKSSLSAAIKSSEQIKNYVKAINEIYAKPVDAFFATFDGQNNCILNEAKF